VGLDFYDLAGLSPDEEGTGRDQFKQAFAPEREALLPAHVTALRPLRHLVFFNLRQAYRARRRKG
jgi:lipid II:glycine glycyltransferase (peptidoglycan interpeptide bridge formation enzyme)